MSRRAGFLVCLAVATLLIRLSLTGEYRQFVKGSMGVWLLVAGVVLAAVTLVEFVRIARAGTEAHHHPTERVGLLLITLVIGVFVVRPGSLGSYALDRTTARDPSTGTIEYLPLDAQRTPRAMTLREFWARSLDRDGASFNGAPVRLVGFVDERTSGELRIARYQIACCAADAIAAIVRVEGVSRPGGRNTWVEVEGTFAGAGEFPALAATSLRVVDEPEDPYE